jgi:hypothetical protein
MECPHCHARNPVGAQWCDLCLRRFAEPAAAPPPLPPPEPRVASHAFLRTTSTTLTRLTPGGLLMYMEPGGPPQAVVTHETIHMGLAERADALLAGESQRHLADRYTVLDLADVPLFRVERYRAVTAPAYAVSDLDGDPIATFLTVDHGIEVRDGASAPVATMHRDGDRWPVVETGGDQVALCWPEELGDRWGLTVFDRPVTLDRRALVAAPLVAWLLFAPSAQRLQRRAGQVGGPLQVVLGM